MQALTAELEAILKSKFQVGDSGFRARVDFGLESYYPTTVDIDHSLQAFASSAVVEFTNEEGEVGLAADVFNVNGLIRIFVWYGDEANEICVFTGFVDKVAEHRDPRGVTVKCRDWAKPLLVQDIVVEFPQGEDEEGAVRDPTNYVYIDYEITDIVRDLLDRSGYPTDQRALQPSNFVIGEWRGRDGATYADMIGELADVIAFNAFADELGNFHFQPDGLADSDTDNPPVPVYTFRTGEDIYQLDPTRDDYDTKTRVRAVGPLTTLKDAWVELWHTNVIKDPTGIMYDPADTGHIYVADGFTKKKYKVSQTTRQIVSSTGVLVTSFLNGLSGDPDDSTVYWTLDAPWILGGAAINNKIRKHLKSNDSVQATFNMPNLYWSDMKVGTDGIYAASYTEDKIYLYNKSTFAQIDVWNVGDGPVGIGINEGTSQLFQLFTTSSTMYISTPDDLEAITDTIVMSGSRFYGIDADTTTDTEVYGVLGGQSLVAKYTLFEPVTTDVSVEVVNDDLEAELGVELDTGIEIRRFVLRLDAVTSYAQATEAANRWLDKIDQFRNVLDVGILGNPAIQKADMVRIEDPVTDIANDFQVDTYRFSLRGNGTYLGVLSLVPWTSSYAGPGDNFPVEVPDPGLLLPRLYFTNDDNTPGRAVDAAWDIDRTGGAAGTTLLKVVPTSGSETSEASWGTNPITPLNVCTKQFEYVLEDTVVFTGGSVRAQILTRSRYGIGIAPQGHYSQMVVKLFDSGGTLKGTLLSAYNPSSPDSDVWANEGDSGLHPPRRNAMFPMSSQWTSALGAPLSGTLTGVAGDYLVVEIGSRHMTGQGGAASGFGVTAYWDKGSDLPDNDSTSTASANAWIEFWGP